MTFQRITLIVAGLMLVVMLLLVVYMMRQSIKSTNWPPMISECPDYFEVVSPGVCNNVKGLGTCQGSAISFQAPEYQGTQGLSQKKQWAQHCGVVWDGITNNDSI